MQGVQGDVIRGSAPDEGRQHRPLSICLFRRRFALKDASQMVHQTASPYSSYLESCSYCRLQHQQPPNLVCVQCIVRGCFALFSCSWIIISCPAVSHAVETDIDGPPKRPAEPPWKGKVR